MNIWITSDTHFGHANMIPYCGRPENFDELLVKNWNRLVKPEDIVIHLGDVIMGQESEKRLASILPTLSGKKILCLGNHDKEKKWGTGKRFMELGFDFAMDYFVYDYYAFSHCPLTPLPFQSPQNAGKEVVLNMHGHFHNSPDVCTPGSATVTESESRYYNMDYFCKNRDRYRLVQIEDTLSPILLEDFLKGGEK